MKDLLELFRAQEAAMDCTPISLLSAWDEYRDRRGEGGPIGYRKMANATLCEIDTTGSTVPASDIRNALKDDHLLPAGMTLIGETNGTSDFELLEDILTNDLRSFPVATVGPSWWSEKVNPQNPLNKRGDPGDKAHVVVVVDMSDREVEVYDPYVCAFHRPPEESIFNIPRVRFRGCWEETVPLREVLWYEPLPSPRQAQLL